MPEVPPQTVLVVDDDPMIAKMLGFVASDAGHAAVVCRDGVEAVEKFVEVVPDLVLLDVVIPRLDGIKVCENLRRLPIGRLTPIVVFSGAYKDADEALRIGADAFAEKPFTPQQIAEHVRRFLPAPVAQPGEAATAPPGPNDVTFAAEPVARALGRLMRARKSGVLTVRSRGRLKYLFFDQGQIVQVRSPDTAAAVTAALVARGRVTAAQLTALEQKARDGGRSTSQLLVDDGLVRADELRTVVLTRMLQEIFETFRWSEGSHAFAEGPPPLGTAAGQLRLEVPTSHLIVWGVRKVAPGPAELDRVISARAAVVARAPEAEELLRGLHFTARERGVLALADGTRTVQEILAVGDLAGTNAAPVLNALLCLGAVVERAGPPVATVPPLPTPVPSASAPRTLRGPFSAALLTLWKTRETGVLRCIGPLDSRTVYVRSGSPAFARSERNAERLEQVLLREGVVTPEQARRALETFARSPDKRMGQILVELGAITLEQLHATVKAHIQGHVLSLFTWTEGKYVFEAGPFPADEPITLEWETPAAILQGIRALPIASVRALAPTADLVVERLRDDGIAATLPLDKAERGVLALLSAPQHMRKLLAGAPDPEVLLRALVAFAALGVVYVHPAEPADLAPAAPPQQPPAGEKPRPRSHWLQNGPALAAFEAEHAAGGVATELTEAGAAFDEIEPLPEDLPADPAAALREQLERAVQTPFPIERKTGK